MKTERARRFRNTRCQLETRGFRASSYLQNHERLYALRGNGISRNQMTLEELESFVDEWDNSQRQQGPLNDAGFAKLATRYRAGETLLRLANDAGVPRTRLRRALIAAGVPMHPLRRLSVATVEDLEGRYLAGKSLRDLAVETGIPYSTIREALIAAGVTMRHGATATSRSSSP